MRFLSFILILTAIAAPGTVHSDAVGHLIGKAEPVLVEIRPSSAARRYIAPQGLEFNLIVEPSCPTDMRIGSVSVTAADTRKTFSGSEFDEQPRIETTLVIPRRQVVAIAIDDFCREDEAAGTRLIDAVYTATLSLRCVSDRQESIVYLTQPLGVILTCINDNNDAESALDQGSSATSTVR